MSAVIFKEKYVTLPTKGEIKAVNKIVRTETKWMVCHDENGTEYVITSNKDRSTYFLYERKESGHEKIAKSRDPTAFDEIIFPFIKPKKTKKKGK